MRVQYIQISLLFITCGLLLSLSACTPAPYHFNVVEKVGLVDGTIYVRATQHCDYCSESENDGAYVYFVSQNDGQTWNEFAAPTEDVLQKLEDGQNVQSAHCLSIDSQLCYRITDKESVDISKDGGATWQIDWQIPPGRKLYMERHDLGPNPDTIPFDIQIIESNTSYVVVVAMGNQGVLVKKSDGDWGRYAVGLAVPTPYHALNYEEAMDILRYSEALVLLLIAVLCFVVLSFCAWISAYINSDTTLRKKFLRIYLFFLSAIGVFLVYSLFVYVAGRAGWLDSPRYYSYLGTFAVLIRFVLFFVYASPILGFVITWLSVITISPGKTGLLTLPLAVVFSFVFYIGVFVPFLLWALGTIPVYETATMVSYMGGIIIGLAALIIEYKIAALAVRPVSKIIPER